eukprot:363915-Chlamydomonas_euryale.AAC.5
MGPHACPMRARARPHTPTRTSMQPQAFPCGPMHAHACPYTPMRVVMRHQACPCGPVRAHE